jgi:cephalosporin hydroxylase
MIQGSSVAEEVVAEVRRRAQPYRRVLVCLDSNHTHEHVLAELEAYAPLTTPGSYCCVFDTVIEDLPSNTYDNRPWGRGDNPKTAVHEYLRRLKDGRLASDGRPLSLRIDKAIERKVQVTVAPDGYLYRPE